MNGEYTNDYRLRSVILSWSLFRIIPTWHRLNEYKDEFRHRGKGFAIYWLGFEFGFEQLVSYRWILITKQQYEEIKCKSNSNT